MMRLKRFIAVNLLLVITMSASACWWELSHAGNVLLYRVIPLDERDYHNYETTWESDCMLHHNVDYKQENLRLWQHQTSKKIPLSDINDVVYETNVCELIDARDHKDYADLYQNRFVKWIIDHQRMDILDYLIMSKQGEKIRMSMNDPWYYYVENDYQNWILQEEIDQCKLYKHGPLYSRYALQMIRALCASSRYNECVDYWNNVKNRLPNDVIRKLCELRAAAALYKTGHQEEALTIYAKYGDVSSIRAVNNGMIENELEFVYNLHPNSPYLEGEIQKWLIYYGGEWIANAIKRDNYSSMDRFNNVLKVAHQAVKEKKSKKMAMWYYTLASLYDIKGEPYKAKKYLEAGGQYHKDQFLKDSYRVLQMWLDAQTAKYDDAYEERLFADLKWLEDKIHKDVPAVFREEFDANKDNGYAIRHVLIGYHERANTFYWNDAMRRILLREVCPRMHKAGKYVREIQLANMAENLLIQVNDYSNEMFLIMDRLSYKATRDYFTRIYHPEDEFDIFLNGYGKVDKYYWYDILATKCLRERRYSKAIVYLRQIPVSFQKEMDVFEYMTKDPFSYDMQTFKDDSIYSRDCKLHFAEKMAMFERTMKHHRNPNKRAEAQIQYALGLRNSVHRCWFLTRYSSNWDHSRLMYEIPEIAYPEDSTTYRHSEYIKLSDSLIIRALDSYKDKEQAAHQSRLLLYYKRIIDEYGETETANDIRVHCDRWRDYAETKDR